MRTFMLIAVLVGLPVQAQAQAQAEGYFWDGNDLVEKMREWDKNNSGQADISFTNVGLYMGYVAAASDVYDTAGVICPPSNATLGQATAIVAAYLKANPTYWHLPAIRLVRGALVAAFRCG